VCIAVREKEAGWKRKPAAAAGLAPGGGPVSWAGRAVACVASQTRAVGPAGPALHDSTTPVPLTVQCRRTTAAHTVLMAYARS